MLYSSVTIFTRKSKIMQNSLKLFPCLLAFLHFLFSTSSSSARYAWHHHSGRGGLDGWIDRYIAVSTFLHRKWFFVEIVYLLWIGCARCKVFTISKFLMFVLVLRIHYSAYKLLDLLIEWYGCGTQVYKMHFKTKSHVFKTFWKVN